MWQPCDVVWLDFQTTKSWIGLGKNVFWLACKNAFEFSWHLGKNIQIVANNLACLVENIQLFLNYTLPLNKKVNNYTCNVNMMLCKIVDIIHVKNTHLMYGPWFAPT